MQNETNRTGLYYVCPSQVFDDERLQPYELKLYMLLSGLAHSNGFCFCSNEYLAGRMKRTSRSIQNWLDKLENFGYIKRDIKKNGMNTDRKIYLTHANSNNSYKRNTFHGRREEDCTVETQYISPIESEENITSKEDVCYPPADHEKISSLEIKNEDKDKCTHQKNLKEPKQSPTPMISKEEVFKHAVLEKKDWTAEEISEAYDVMASYKGLIRDFLRFIDGTISNLRNKKKSDFLAQRKGNKTCQKKEKKKYEEYKEISSGEGMKAQTLVPFDLSQNT